MKLSVQEGEFKILRPARSINGYWIIGAIVGSDARGMTYTKRIANPKDILNEMWRLKERILKDHPGIKEIFGEQ